MLIFRFCRMLCWLVAKIYFRFEALQIDNIPKEGGILLTPNHVSFLDPPLSGIGLKRPTHFFARNTLMKNFLLTWFFKKLNCIAVNRDQLDTKTFRKAVKLVQSGEILVMFPEGTRSSTGELQPGQQGIGMIAHHAGVKVVPCYIDGARNALPRGTQFPKPQKIRVIYGKPLDFTHFPIQTKREAYAAIANQIMEEIKKLKQKIQA